LTLNLDPSPLARLRVPRPVDRYEYIRRRCAGRRVLDLGAYDETEVERPQHASWRWLHAVVADSAKEVLGVDASPSLRDSGGIDTKVGTRIVYGSVEDLTAIVEDYQPDLIVAGELIEHTQDTLGWLSRLARQAPGVQLIATTPNTTSIVNMLLTLGSRENAHPDHIHVYSYRTLSTIAGRVPVRDMTITPYWYDPHLFYSRVPAAAGVLVTAFDRAVLRPIQWLWPLSAFGLILDGVLGES
jgi:Methyltransferase domain